MFGLGMSEILFLAVLALVVIGPKELPQLARTLGRFLNELKRTSNILTDDLKHHVRFDDFNIDSAMNRSRKVKAHENRQAQAQHEQSVDDVHDENHPDRDYDKDHDLEDPAQMEFSEHHDANPSADDSTEKKKS